MRDVESKKRAYFPRNRKKEGNLASGHWLLATLVESPLAEIVTLFPRCVENFFHRSIGPENRDLIDSFGLLIFHASLSLNGNIEWQKYGRNIADSTNLFPLSSPNNTFQRVSLCKKNWSIVGLCAEHEQNVYNT